MRSERRDYSSRSKIASSLRPSAFEQSPGDGPNKRKDRNRNEVDWQEVRHKELKIEEYCTGTLGGASQRLDVFDVDQAAVSSKEQFTDQQQPNLEHSKSKKVNQGALP